MFDIGFFELIVIAIVGLLVIGPERLPEMLRKFMLWRGRLASQFNHLRNNIEKEIGADEIRQQIQNEAIMHDYQYGKDLVDSLHEEMQSLNQNAQSNTAINNPEKCTDNNPS